MTRLWLPSPAALVSYQHESRARIERDYRFVADHIISIRPVGDWLDRLVWEIEHAQLAPAFVRASAPTTGGEFDTSITISFDATGCDYLHGSVSSAFNASSVTSPAVTYNGVAQTLVQASTLGPSNRARVWTFGKEGPTSGTNNYVFTQSGGQSMDRVVVSVVGYSGVDQSTPRGTPATNNGDSGAITVNASSATGELVVDSVASGGSGTLTVGAGQTSRASGATGNGNARGATSEEAGAGTVTMSWTLSAGDEWGINAVSLKAAAGGGGTKGPPRIPGFYQPQFAKPRIRRF